MPGIRWQSQRRAGADMTATQIADDHLAATIRRAEADLAVEMGLPSAPVEHVIPMSEGLVRVLEFTGRADLPPVVLLHGLASVTAAAIPLIASIGQRRVFAVDWPVMACRQLSSCRGARCADTPSR